MTNTQTWNPELYARNARFVSDLGMPVVELLAPKPGERILDLGCGDGALTTKLVALGCEVVGVDSSPEQVAAAVRLGLDARVMDGHALDFDGEFDAVFSNAALHWMRRPDDVIAGVARALRPGGRFVGEFGGAGNIQAIVTRYVRSACAGAGSTRSGSTHGTIRATEEYRSRLEAHGFRVRSIALFPRPTPQPGDISGWLETFTGAFLSALPEDARPGFIAELREALRPALLNADGTWVVDYVRLRFAADKPGDAHDHP